MPRPIRSVLIANRGVIAVRIIRTLREMGIRAVAVYSTADAGAPHVTLADEAHPIGPPPPRESYLRIDALIDVARRAGCDAVHPGYGFLSENPDFADAVAKAGLAFIGPTGAAIRAIGNKLSARTLLKGEVPTVPGMDCAVDEAPDAGELERRIGFPFLIKAAAGGGGRGMRVVRGPGEFQRALNEARAEAATAFGDPTVFIEKYVGNPRHVEIQLLADEQGSTVYLGERECSIQRRHQKLIEETPSPVVDAGLRRAMGEAAVRAARKIGYTNAGTAEFLVDAERNFYFLEVNTRLQVEHPVTEAVTGLDLVREQVRVAEGRPLPFRQEDLRPRGHAVECRICAEDPAERFMPSTGDILGFEVPGGPFVRVDHGLAVGGKVGLFYDSMLAKLITWGGTRDEALDRMARALREFRIVGVRTTIPFLAAVMDHPEFRAGRFDTGFIDRHLDGLLARDGNVEIAALLAAALDFELKQRGAPVMPDGVSSGWTAAARIEGKRNGGFTHLGPIW